MHLFAGYIDPQFPRAIIIPRTAFADTPGGVSLRLFLTISSTVLGAYRYEIRTALTVIVACYSVRFSLRYFHIDHHDYLITRSVKIQLPAFCCQSDRRVI